MGDGGASRAAKNASREAEKTQALLRQQTEDAKKKALRDAEKAQRIMMRSMRGAGGGFFMRASNNPTLNEPSGVLG